MDEKKPDARSVIGVYAAAAAMAPNAALWAAVVVQQSINGPWPLAVSNAFAVLATVVAGAAVLKRAAAAYLPALVLCYFDAFWSAIWASHGAPFLWIAAASSLAAAVLLTASRKAFPGLDEHVVRQKEDHFVLWLRENLESIVVAFIMALVIRCFCIEVFKIPSSSMEPTLLGDLNGKHTRKTDEQSGCDFSDYHVAPSGDRIMVTKYYYALNPVERFDVVVFKFPLNEMKNFIKRVVGLPDEQFFLEGGNIFTRPIAEPQGRFRLARKPLRIQQSLWIRNGKTGLGDDAKFDECWKAEQPAEAYDAAGDILRTLQYRDKSGRDSRSSRFRYRSLVTDGEERTVGELSASFDLELRDKKGSFFFEIPNEFGRFRLELSSDQPGFIRWSGTRVEKIDLRTPKLEPDRRYRIEFMVYDGIAVAMIDGKVEAELTFCDFYDEARRPQTSDVPAFGSDETIYVLSALRLGRDIYYKERDHAFPLEGVSNAVTIPPDDFLMMGDNVNSSHDSRAWKEHVFTLTEAAARKYGRKDFRCETLDIQDGDERAKNAWKEKHGLAYAPDHYLQADVIGYERGFDESEVLRHDVNPAPFVPREYLVGKALWIWWPPGRWGRLIR